MANYYEYKVTRSNNDSFEKYEIKIQADACLSTLKRKESSQEDIEDAIYFLQGMFVLFHSCTYLNNRTPNGI